MKLKINEIERAGGKTHAKLLLHLNSGDSDAVKIRQWLAKHVKPGNYSQIPSLSGCPATGCKADACRAKNCKKDMYRATGCEAELWCLSIVVDGFIPLSKTEKLDGRTQKRHWEKVTRLSTELSSELGMIIGGTYPQFFPFSDPDPKELPDLLLNLASYASFRSNELPRVKQPNRPTANARAFARSLNSYLNYRFGKKRFLTDVVLACVKIKFVEIKLELDKSIIREWLK